MGNNGTRVTFDSFQLIYGIQINAPRKKIWKAMTQDIDKWWYFRLLGDDSKLTLDPVAGGMFIEKGVGGSSALLATAMLAREPEYLRFSGPLGMDSTVSSIFWFSLDEKVDSTLVQVNHHAFGQLMPSWKDDHDRGWKTLLGTYLKSYVEEGKTRQEIKTEGE